MNFDEIYKTSAPYTITSVMRIKKLHESVIYLNENNIEGDFVECGVYKGGCIMNMALTQMNFEKRVDIHLYDTFTGMTSASEFDVNHQDVPARRILTRQSKLCIASLEEVKKNVNLTGYPKKLLHYHQGDVATTLTKNLPEKISLLRLDTDWYESTKIELEVLYPRLTKGGILILDDYGYWKGARKAVDEYFASINNVDPELKPIEDGISAVWTIKK